MLIQYSQINHPYISSDIYFIFIMFMFMFKYKLKWYNIDIFTDVYSRYLR